MGSLVLFGLFGILLAKVILTFGGSHLLKFQRLFSKLPREFQAIAFVGVSLIGLYLYAVIIGLACQIYGAG
jgi:hypothetical protein